MSGTAAPGTLVTPSIELERRIGAGGMGTVWIAFHRGLRKKVAVKLMADSILSSEELRSRFAQEAVAGANVKSPHVVQVFDTGANEDLGPYIVMELLEGEDLATRLAREDVLAPALVARIVTQASHALDRAHAIGIVHRDIKPANLFLCLEEGAPFLTKVLDFGVATLRRESDQRTATGISVGTPTYMSPEQAAARQDLDGKSDLYSLALVAFRALTGSVAFPRESIQALGPGVYNLPPPKLSERRASLPRALDEWFARACAKERDARFPNGATMAAELARALDIETPAAVEREGEKEEDAPTSDGPTRLPVATNPVKPEPTPLMTDAGLTQKTLGDPPPKKRKLAPIAAAALGIAGLVGWAVVHRSPEPAPETKVVATVTPSASVAPPVETIPIGILLDLSGERRQNGQKLLAASRAAEDLVNRAGGVRGHPIRLVVKDDQGDTGKFLTDATRALLQVEHVQVIVGPMTSKQIEIVLPLAKEAGALELTGSATSPELTTIQRPEERSLFRTVPSQTLQAKALARVMRGAARVIPFVEPRAVPVPESPRCASVAIVATDDVIGRPFADVFKRELVTNGGRVVATRFVASDDQSSYEADIHAVVESRADCQVLVLGPKAAARYLRQSRSEPLEADAKRPATFAVGSVATSDFLVYARANPRDELSASVADNVRGVRPATSLTWRPEYNELVHLLAESDAGADVSAAPFVASQFDATILAALSLEAAGADAGAAELRKSIRDISRGGRVYGPHEMPQLLAAIRRGEKVDYVGASGDVDLDENGDVESDLVTWIATHGAIVETGRIPRAAR